MSGRKAVLVVCACVRACRIRADRLGVGGCVGVVVVLGGAVVVVSVVLGGAVVVVSVVSSVVVLVEAVASLVVCV